GPLWLHMTPSFGMQRHEISPIQEWICIVRIWTSGQAYTYSKKKRISSVLQ
ncbi:hypothetical protein A3Q56_08654, partial [Intoshia linei]